MKNLTQRSRGAEGNDPMMNVLHVPPVPDVPAVNDESQPSTEPHAPWPRVKLGEVCEVTAGNSAPQEKNLFSGGIYPFVRTSDVGEIHFGHINSSRDKLNDAGIRKMQLFPKGSVLFPKSGASTFLNHRVLLDVDAYVVSHLAVIIPHADIDSEYLLSYLATIDAKKLMQDVNYPALRTTEIADIDIPLPPLSAQREIVARLERELGAVEKVAKAFGELERAAEGEFKAELKETFESLGGGDEMVGRSPRDRRNREPTESALEGGFGAQGTARPTAVRRVKFGEVCESISSRGHQIKQSEIAEVGRFPVVSQSENEIEGYTDRDIAISEIPLVLFGDHTCAVKLIDKPFVVGADGVKLLRVADCLPRYLYSWLLQAAAKLLDGEYRRHFADLCELIIPLPPFPVQREIVARLDAARERKDRLISAAKRGREAAALWRKAILKEAFE